MIESKHTVDEKGFPAGGETTGRGISVSWQNGPLNVNGKREEPNGAFVEDIIRTAIDRIEFYQTAADGKFRCRENALTITKLEEALHWCQHRTRDREERGVEGTQEV